MTAKKLNILFLNSIEPTIWGGLENWMEMCGLGLARIGHSVVFAGRTGSLFLQRVSEYPEAQTLALDISGDFSPRTIRQIAGIIGEKKINLAMCNFVKDVRLAGLARLATYKYKIVWTPGVNLAKKSVSHKLLFTSFVDHAIVPSNALKDKIIESSFIDSSLFETIPIGLDTSLWNGNRRKGRQFICNRYPIPEDAFICLSSGRFVPQKGHGYLIRAARHLIKNNNKIYFLLLGSGRLETELAGMVDEFEISDRVVFGGLLENHQPVVFGADLFVHSAITEPYGIVLVEAMAAGLPVVATRVGGIPEVVLENKNALLVDAADTQQLTNGIAQFYNDRELCREFGDAGRKRFEDLFTMQKMIERLEKTLIKVAGH